MKDHLNDTLVEENTLTATNDNTIFIVDAMAFVHQNQDSGCSSFSDLQQRLLKQLLSVYPTQCTCVNCQCRRRSIYLRIHKELEIWGKNQTTTTACCHTGYIYRYRYIYHGYLLQCPHSRPERVVDAKGMQLYRMSHNSEFARREVYIASDIGLFCSSLCAHYEWMRHS